MPSLAYQRSVADRNTARQLAELTQIAAPGKLHEFTPANVGLHRRIGDAHNFDIAPAGEVIGRRAGSASEIQQPHPILRLQKNEFGFVRARKCRSGEHACAVVRLLIPIRAENVIICTLLVIVLEIVVRLRCPLDQLALLELIQLVADLARVPRLGHQEKKYVMKKVVSYEQRDGDRHYQLKYQYNVQSCSAEML